jgi:hypothetical protein
VRSYLEDLGLPPSLSSESAEHGRPLRELTLTLACRAT